MDEAERKYKNFVKIVDIPKKSDMIISVIITNINKEIKGGKQKWI